MRNAKQSFYNPSLMDTNTLIGDQDHISVKLEAYIPSFSPSVQNIFERFGTFTQIDLLDKCWLLYQVTENFTGIDLHRETLRNTETGTVFHGDMTIETTAGDCSIQSWKGHNVTSYVTLSLGGINVAP